MAPDKIVTQVTGYTTVLYRLNQMMCKSQDMLKTDSDTSSSLSPRQITVGWLQFLRSDWSCSRWEGGGPLLMLGRLRLSPHLCSATFNAATGWLRFALRREIIYWGLHLIRESKQTWQTVWLLIHALFPIRLLWTRRLCETDNAPLPRTRTYPKEGARAILSTWTGTRRWKSQIALMAKVNTPHLSNIQQIELYFSGVVSEMHFKHNEIL